MNESFEFYLKAQAALGRTRQQALSLLKRSWEIEDADKLEGYAEVARITSRVR